MNNYKMKVLRQLKEAEEQVKQGVRRQLNSSRPSKKKSYMPFMIGAFGSLLTILLLVVLIQPSEDVVVIQGSKGFSIGEVALVPLKIRESTFIAADFSWNGKEQAVLQSVELIDTSGNVVNYEEHQFVMRPWNANALKPGQYRKQEIQDFVEMPKLTFDPNGKHTILLEFIANTGFVTSDHFALQFTYHVNGQTVVKAVEWPTLATVTVEQLNFEEVAKGLGVSDEELAVYETFKQSRDPMKLANLTPLAIARLYLLAEIEGNDALQFAFYTTREDTLSWSYEEQLTFPPFERHSLSESIELFEAISTGTFIPNGENDGYISFTKDGMDQGFQLFRNEQDIWQVAFMPLQ